MKVYNNNDGSTGRISTSKGNQVKMKVGEMWYKTDYLGYEGASEYICSELLKYTNIFDYVKYKLEEIEINGTTYNGCVSNNFLKKGAQLITADRLFKQFKNENISQSIANMKLEEKITYFVNGVENITGLKDFGKHLTQMLEWDRFVLNEDRHFNNIAFIYENGIFKPAPIFDNGAAFLSDIRFDYPLIKYAISMSYDVEAKPFDKDFDKQVEACEKLYGKTFFIAENIEISEEIKANLEEFYGPIVTKRITDLFDNQKYLYDEYLVSINHDYDEPDDDLEL